MKFHDRRFVQHALGLQHQDRDAQEILNDYHKMLKEATENYPVKYVSLKYLKMLAMSNNKQVKSSFSLLPAQHQIILYQVIDQTICLQLQSQKQQMMEKEKRKESLYKYELRLDRMNLKIQGLLSYIGELESKKSTLEAMELTKQYDDFKATKSNLSKLMNAGNII